MKKEYIRIAKKRLEKIPLVGGQHRVVAICLYKNKIVSVGVNSYTKSHTRQRRFAERAGTPEKEYLHAEVDAIIKARYRPIDKIVVIRFNKAEQLACAEPCSICKLAIKAAKIKYIEYTI